ncbi:secretion system protein [Halobacteriales archaeon QH_7_65_31]|nr:MAG: secretion system protein [Halobacteriales archaeon QH_7_65_31]
MEIPAPVAPDDPEAWYAPDVRAQTEVSPGVVATIREQAGDAPFAYEVREPSIPGDVRDTLDELHDRFAAARRAPPRTTTGVRERFTEPLPASWRERRDRAYDGPPATTRRLDYHLRATHRGLGELTPLALDDRIETVDTGETVAIHTERFAPALTEFEAAPDRVARLASERRSRETVDFCGYEIPVVRYRDRTLGTDGFTLKYAVDEPPLRPGDRDRIDRCRRRLLATADEFDTDDPDAVEARARRLLRDELTAATPSAWLTASRARVRRLLADCDLAAPPVEPAVAPDRLDDLSYYVVRDLVGEGRLTIPLRDERLDAVEASVESGVTVRPRDGAARRLPTNIEFDADSLREQVRRLAAAGGTDLSAQTPTATVTVRPSGTDATLDCTLGLARTTDSGPQLSVRRRPADPPTAPELVAADRLPAGAVALCWLLAETRGTIAIVGERGAGKTTLLNALLPFVPHDHRPVVAGDTAGVTVPHDSSLRLATHDHADPERRISVTDVGAELTAIDPSITVLDDVDGPGRSELLAERLAAGAGVLATVDAADPDVFARRLAEWTDSAETTRRLDAVLVTRHIDGERRVTAVGRFTDAATEAGSAVTPAWTEHWSRGDGALSLDRTTVADRLAVRTDQSTAALAAEFDRKRRYVEYLVDEEIDRAAELFGFLADLYTDETGTVERVSHRRDAYK